MKMNVENDKKFALLIDADNISPKYIDIILTETVNYGVASIRRIYGDWTDNAKRSWKECLLLNSLTPVQQFSNTTGKNASDGYSLQQSCGRFCHRFFGQRFHRAGKAPEGGR